MNRLKTALTILMLYITVAGLVTFSLFILEEAFQTAMFGTWPAQDARRWDLVKIGSDVMESNLTAMRWVTYGLGWVQPLALLSYHHYAKSAQSYIDSLRSKVLAHRPDLFLGEQVTLELSPKAFTELPDGSILKTFGQVGVIIRPEDNRRTFSLSGRLEVFQGFYVIDTRR